MRCYCCDKPLNDFESTRKSAATGDYLDMCNKCFNTIKEDVNAEERYDLYDGDDNEHDESEQDEE